LTLSVHSLACHPLMVFDTDEQRQEWLPAMLLGRPACAGFPALWCQKDTTWLSFGKPEQKYGSARGPNHLRALPRRLHPGRPPRRQGRSRTSDRFSALDAGYLASLRSPLAWPRRPLMTRASGFRQDDHRPSGIPALADVNGGAIALGRPIGMSGAPITYCTWRFGGPFRRCATAVTTTTG